jgi:hypothetical protein
MLCRTIFLYCRIHTRIQFRMAAADVLIHVSPPAQSFQIESKKQFLNADNK